MDGAGGGGAAYTSRTAEEVFRDLRGRRAGMIKALTTDVDKFYKLCDPEKENLCLYGYPNETWEVTLPAEEVPPEIPEPALGINFARDGMNEKDWLALVAVHSDSWLLSVAFYFGARFGFDKENRLAYAFAQDNWKPQPIRILVNLEKEYRHILEAHKGPFTGQGHKGLYEILTDMSLHMRRLFNMINNLPTIFEVVTDTKKQTKEKTPNSSSKSNKPSSKVQSRAESRSKAKLSVPKDEEESGDDDGDEEEEEHDNTLCGTCGTNDGKDEFWICCDNCEKWYHGKCVKITPARAEHIKHYRCPECSSTNKRVKT